MFWLQPIQHFIIITIQLVEAKWNSLRNKIKPINIWQPTFARTLNARWRFCLGRSFASFYYVAQDRPNNAFGCLPPFLKLLLQSIQLIVKLWKSDNTTLDWQEIIWNKNFEMSLGWWTIYLSQKDILIFCWITYNLHKEKIWLFPS